MTDERKTKVKRRVISQARRLFTIVIYLWALFTVLELHTLVILRQQIGARAGYRVGFAFLKALVLGKVIFIAEELHVGEKLREMAIVYSSLLKSAIFSAILICFNILEEVIVGMIRGKTVADSIPSLGGGGFTGVLLVAVISFVVLIPFFAFEEVKQVIGETEFYSMLFRPRKKPAAAELHSAGS